jgi:hypothetical protein
MFKRLDKATFKEIPQALVDLIRQAVTGVLDRDDYRGRRGRKGSAGKPGEPGPPGESIEGEPGKRGESGESIEGEPGKRGKLGKRGKPGEEIEGPPGKRGQGGPPGPLGLKGDPGPIPRHKWSGTRLSFEDSDGKFSRSVDLQGPGGGRGGRGAAGGSGARELWDSITLNIQDLIFSKPKAGPLGPSTTVDLSSLTGLKNFVIVTTTTHTAGDEDVIYVDDDAAGGPVNISLPSAADGKRVYYIKKRGNTAPVTITGDGGDLVEGTPTIVLLTQNESVTLHSDFVGWSIL